ncbi:MAG: tRNA guanosine(34) transglycosylase Tgt, partial [Acidimicrobiia bacterium]|nr:tRNA guanosine(34) transglycosylase Tgt [Acidimicrobiia bacterium]
MSAVEFVETATDGSARSGVLSTPHGDVPTPAFMPVGTRGTVKTVDVADLRAVGASMVLANTYHLMLRPGHEVVAGLGGLHGFMAWDGPILTDSGGYQVFSLDPRLDESGVTFKSTYDGSTVELTPEGAVEVQQKLGADIAMVLDHLVGLPADRDQVRDAMERTLRWSERALAAHTRTDQALFGIVQGGVDPELRAESARRTAELGVAGFGIGGLSVGEAEADRNRAIEVTVDNLPADKVRYTMGLGDTDGIIEAISRGVDLFDCVLPTRLARHGKAITRTGDISIKRAEWASYE